jgi:hypothetical protein
MAENKINTYLTANKGKNIALEWKSQGTRVNRTKWKSFMKALYST